MLDRPWVPHTYLENQRRWVAIRQMLVREQDGLCAICGQPMRQGDRNIDHVWPRGAGGYHGLGNLVAAHFDCNNRKGHQLPTGCEIIQLVAVCARLDVPVRLKA